MDPMPVSLACPLTSVSWELGAGAAGHEASVRPLEGAQDNLRSRCDHGDMQVSATWVFAPSQE